jgi:hypothetical protein
MNREPAEIQEELVERGEVLHGRPEVNTEPAAIQEEVAAPEEVPNGGEANDDLEEFQERLTAPAEVLQPGVQHSLVVVDGKPELILPNDYTPFSECAERCFTELARTRKFFRQGNLVVELVECSNGHKLLELTVEGFRSRLENYFILRSFVMLHGRRALRPKLCSQDNAKALLATEASLKYLPPIQAVVNSPVFAEDEEGHLIVLNQGYHSCHGGIYVLRKRNIDTAIKCEKAVKALLGILNDFFFCAEADRSRCIAGIISPALRFGRLLDADFPLDMCEADQSQTGKTFRMKLISQIYGESPFVVVKPSELKKGVGSLDESLSEALLSGRPFIVLENLRGEVSSQLLESAIRGGDIVSVRCAYSRTTLIETDHVYWMATSNRAQTTPDLANRSFITRLRKRDMDKPFTTYVEGNLLEHVEARRDYYLSCIHAVIRDWHTRGKPKTGEQRHDFREWAQTLDWIIQKKFKLPAPLEGHRSEQLRMSSVGLSFLRDVALLLQSIGECGLELTTAEIAHACEHGEIDIPGCSPAADSGVILRRIGTLLGPLFRESEEIAVEGFVVKRTQELVYDKVRKENRRSKTYCFKPRR